MDESSKSVRSCPRIARICSRQLAVLAVNRLQRRFFSAKRGFTDREIEFFMEIDFATHVALVALIKENEGQIIAGGGRYILARPGQAEVAFLVVDDYQGSGHWRTLDPSPGGNCQTNRASRSSWRKCCRKTLRC